MTAPQRAPRSNEPTITGLDSRQLAARLGTPLADLYRACELGLLPEPGPGGRWPQPTVAQIALGWEQTSAAIEAARDLGGVRSAELLARLTGLPVTAVHLPELVNRGLLAPSRSYKNRPMYRVSDLHTLTADPAAHAVLTEITTAAPRRRP